MPSSSVIPLFPLNVVLFPGMTLPLHVFEPRYVAMLRHCLEGDESFGVALIRTGDEVGVPALPHRIGARAVIQRCRQRPDGHFDVTTVGRERFSIRCLFRQRPFVEAEVDWLEEEDLGHPRLDEAVRLARETFTRYVELQQQVTGRSSAPLTWPAMPDALSYFIAAHAALGLGNRQQLLETHS